MDFAGDIRLIFAFYSPLVKDRIKPVLSGLQASVKNAASTAASRGKFRVGMNPWAKANHDS
ncbi:MAG: hypothetical protein DMG24_11865 [Acidobacteria bacterium]|nr:MAG: hypothetical protein DMG24_11865 [Acidobacteriota bacterium]